MLRFFFFFSSRRRHTRYWRDWSSDVCSSDLMSTQIEVAMEKMVFRKTNGQTGRHLAVTPENSTMRHLSYGRIILNSSKPSISFSNGDRETGLICLSGKAVVKAAGKEFELGKFDAIYVPRDSS